jgi:lipid II:glycine glycyltransferase (peptidoglycan interpeptide bridge formation enzyme)
MERYTQYANSIFEQPWWLDIVATDSWSEVVIEENGEVIGRLPFVISKKFFCTMLKMPKLTQTLGPWIKYRDYKEGNEHLSLQKNITNRLLEQLPISNYTKIVLDSSNNYVLPYKWFGYRIKPNFSYRLSDLSNLEEIYNNFNKTAKKNIRRSQKKIIISYETNIDILLNIMNITFGAQNRKYPISSDLIRKIVNECDTRNAGQMFTAVDEDGNIHACTYVIYDKNVCYALLGGSNPSYRNSGAKSLVWWESIKFASKVSKAFDFEGSMIESIEKFVRQFGGTPIVNYEITKIPLLFEVFEILKPKIKKILKYKQ